MAKKISISVSPSSVRTTWWLYWGMVVSLVSALVVSLYHLSVSVAAYEVAEGWLPPGLTAWIFAIAVESGVLFISSGIADRKRRGESAQGLYWSLGFFTVVNFYGNASYTLANIAGVQQLIWKDVQMIDGLKIVSSLLFSVVLPIMIITMSGLRSQFHQRLKSEEMSLRIQEAKQRRLTEQKAAREDRKAQRIGMKSFHEKSVTTVTPAQEMISTVAAGVTPEVRSEVVQPALQTSPARASRVKKKSRRAKRASGSKTRGAPPAQDRGSHGVDTPDVFERGDGLQIPTR